MSGRPSGKKSPKKSTQPGRREVSREAEPDGVLAPTVGLDASAEGLVNGLPEILVVLNHEGTITFASGTVASHVKISAADLMGKSAWEFIHPDDLGDAVRSLSYTQTADGRPMGPFLFRYFDREGNVRTADAVAVNRKDAHH